MTKQEQATRENAVEFDDKSLPLDRLIDSTNNAEIIQQLRQRIKKIIEQQKVTVEDNEVLQSLSAKQDSDLKELLGKNYKKLMKLVKSEEQIQGIGPAISAEEYHSIAKKINDNLRIPLLNGEILEDKIEDISIVGSLRTGWSDQHQRGSDSIGTSDVDIKIIVDDAFWSQITETIKIENPTRTVVLDRDSIAQVDPVLVSFLDGISELTIAGETKRPVHVLFQPRSEYISLIAKEKNSPETLVYTSGKTDKILNAISDVARDLQYCTG